MARQTLGSVGQAGEGESKKMLGFGMVVLAPGCLATSQMSYGKIVLQNLLHFLV